MNRILQAFLLISIVLSPAIGQEPDTARVFQQPDRAKVFQQSDTVSVSQQPDSIQQFTERDLSDADTLMVVEPDYSHSAYKAIMYALVLPGLGQGYNKSYYKIPIVVAALGGIGYAIGFNTKMYRESSSDYALLPDATNERYLRYWRRNVELSYIGLILVYALQVLDAYVAAQLYNWDVNDNLSLRVAPSLQPMLSPVSVTGHVYGFTCSIDFKRR
jgi:hypothetical protein